MALTVLLGGGCSDGKDAASERGDLTDARLDAARFGRLYFDGHQAGRLRPEDWAHLREVTARAVFVELREAYRTLPKPAPWGGCPAVDAKVERWRGDEGARKVLADIRARCEKNPAVGLGVAMRRRDEGNWVVASLRDARCDEGAPPVREVNCSFFRSR